MVRRIVVLALAASLVGGGTAAVAAGTAAVDAPGNSPFKPKAEQKAKELGIDTKDKDLPGLIREISQAKRDRSKERLYREAARLNVPTEGRSQRDIAGDVRKARLYNAAQKLNVPTEGKTIEQITRDLREAAKKQSIQKSGTLIQTFTAPFVR